MVQEDWDGNVEWKFGNAVQVEIDGNLSWSARQNHDLVREGCPIGYYVPGMTPKIEGGRTLMLSYRSGHWPKITMDHLPRTTRMVEVTWDGEIVWDWMPAENFEQFGHSEAARNAIMRRCQDRLAVFQNTVSYVGQNRWFDTGDERFHPKNIITDDRGTILYIISKQTGEIVWSNSIQARHETFLGGIGPRSTPTISNGRVYCLGATAILCCLDGSSGKMLREKDLLALTGSTPDQDIKTIAWGRSSSPLVVDELVIIPLGGPPAGPHISLLALDATSGEGRWQSGDRQASYASPSLVELGGEEQVVIVSADLVSGHRLEDGKQLWTYSWSGSSSGSASVSQAATLGNNRLLLSKGYGEGAAVIEVRRTAGEGTDFEIETIWTSKQVLKTKFTNVAVKDGFAYGLSDGILECVDLSSGIRRWKKGRLGHGQLLRLADVLVVLAEDGMVWQIATNPEKYQVLGRFPAVEGKCWATLCLYDNLLLVRAEEEAACYELPLTRSR